LFKNILHLPARIAKLVECSTRLESRIHDLDAKIVSVESDLKTAAKMDESLTLHQLATRHELSKLMVKVESLSIVCGQLKATQACQIDKPSLRDVEFKVFSQFGEDGIIQYLISRLEITDETFIEFGVEDYTESNTRFLLVNNNWKGLVIDGNPSNIDAIRNSEIYWRHDITAVPAFINASNINQIITDNGFSGEIGLLSIDIDGNDYWVWRAIDCVNPVLVICEYNCVFGNEHSLTIPYTIDFQRSRAHYSHLYFGASLPALRELAESKGYNYVGCNSNGNNAFFVRNSHAHRLHHLIGSAEFVLSKTRDSRDDQGRLNFVSSEERRTIIKDMPVLDLSSQRVVLLGDLS